MSAVGYERVTAVAEAAALLREHENAVAVAGGVSLTLALRQGRPRPSLLVDLTGVAGLSDIAVVDDRLRIGALATHADVADSDTVRDFCPALAALAASIGDPQVRNRGTLGGAFAVNDPAGDYPAAALALAATVVTSTREVAADMFLVGAGATALAADELIVSVEFRRPRRAAYRKFMNPASGYAMAGVFVAETSAGVRVAVTGAGRSSFRHSGMEAALAERFHADALADVPIDDRDLREDLHADRAYRAQLVRVMASRAAAAASAG